MRVIFLSCILVLCSVVVEAQTVLKISTLYPPGSAAVTSLQQIALELKQNTNNEVLIKVYPGGVMGDDSTVLRKLRIGQLQGALVSSSTLELIDADVKALSQPFSYDEIAQVYDRRESYDHEILAELSRLGWAGFGPLDGGFSYLMSKNKVTDMDGVRSSKLWLPNTRDIQKMSESLDIDYLVMNIGDVLTGLDTGAINTLVSPPSAALALNWHSRFNYFSDTPVLYTWGILIFPEKSLAKLSDKNRKLVDDALTQWSEELDQNLRASNENALVVIRQLMTAITFSADELNSLRVSQQNPR